MRDPVVQRFIEASEAAVMAAAEPGSPAEGVAREVFRRCHARVGGAQEVPPAMLPVCGWLEAALDSATEGPRRAVADALEAMVDRLEWERRDASDPANRAFHDGHANALILGPGGLEERDDLWVGVTLMAPGVTYVDHRHPPAEVYLSLAPGEWWNAGMDWTDPGMDRLIYNPPGILHAMRSGDRPFLALWYLPL